MLPARIVIYPKDVQRITGRSERQGRRLLKKIKAHFSKADHQWVSVEEFCNYTGLRTDQLRDFL